MYLTKFYPTINLLNEIFNDVTINKQSKKSPIYDVIENDDNYQIDAVVH